MSKPEIEMAVPHVASNTIQRFTRAISGPGRWLLPSSARRSLLRVHNAEALRRLAYLSERRPDDKPY